MRVSVPELAISIDAPEGVTIEESVYGDWATLEAPGFSLVIDAFVPEGSAFGAEEARGRLSRDARITYEEIGERSWRFDYEMPDGTLGTLMRIHEPCMLDVRTWGCTRAERDAVIAASATIRWMTSSS
jgi:hypothetical protein